jgi:hypothetical protein
LLPLPFFLMMFTSASLAAPNRVAILPLRWGEEVSDETRQRFHKELEFTRQVIFDAFAMFPFEDVPLDMVDQWLNREEPAADDFRSLQEYAVNAVLQGEITQISISRGGIVGRTAAGLRLALIDVRTGETVWEGAEKDSRTGGALLSSGQLTFAFDALNVSLDEGQLEYSFVLRDLLLKLFTTLPQTPVSLEPPQIAQAEMRPAASAQAETLQAITVYASGTPGCRAFFHLPRFSSAFPMIETQPGSYYGYAAVEPASLRTEPVQVTIVNHYGIQSRKEIAQ